MPIGLCLLNSVELDWPLIYFEVIQYAYVTSYVGDSTQSWTWPPSVLYEWNLDYQVGTPE